MNANARLIKIISISLLAIFIFQMEIMAARNPLNNMAADSFDAQSGKIKTEPCSEGGQNLCSIHDGDYTVYKACDFDSGVAAFKARIAALNPGAIEIRLDSPKGIMIGRCAFKSTGGWQDWRDLTCKVDNSQAGVRDVYLLFHGTSRKALVNVSSFVFLKSVPVGLTPISTDLQNRVDTMDDEPQATAAWGMPEAGFRDNFADGSLNLWQASGITIATNADGNGFTAISCGTNLNFAFTPNVYINKSDTGGEWRTLAEASLSADIVIDSPQARPGIGFSSKNGKQWIYVVLNPNDNSIEAWRKLAEDSVTRIKRYASPTNTAAWSIHPGVKYRLTLDWSPYSDGLIVFLNDDKGQTIASFRTVIDVPAARRPLLVCSGGNARFNNVKFDPTLDGWNFQWQWKKTPVLTPDVCNPAVWKGKDGKYYMMWRKFGADTYHGIATSTDGVNWTQVSDQILKCTGDMNVLLDPFGDGLVYVTPGGNNLPWFASDGTDNFTVWKDTGMTVGNIFGNSRIQEIIDRKKHPQMSPIRFKDQTYRFIAFTENWVSRPQPHTVVLLSNTLTNWILADPSPLIPPGADFWGEKGNAVGAAFVLADGNILLACCACTFAGYTGAPEPSNVSVIVDGRQPWKILKLGTLPDAPVSRENVWYQGPNFGTAFLYEPENDTLFYYGGFHDYNIGVMRVQNFSKAKLFTASQRTLLEVK